MRKSILGIFLLLAVAVMAGQRSPEQAAEIAAQFTNNQPQLRRMHASERQAVNLKLVHKALQLNSENAAFYVFNQENNHGFVIVSADDRTAEDVLLYSDEGAFDAEKINPSFQWWLNRFAEEITVLQTIDDSEFIDQPKARKAQQVTAIKPLLKNAAGREIKWYQEAPYYNLCPMDERDSTRSLTGCVATAASMIMYKWCWPRQGTGSKSYTWYNCLDDYCNQYKTKTLSANFGETTYDWDNMLPSYEGWPYTTEQANAVATIMYHAGVACEMVYGGDATGGSGAWTDEMGYGLKNYFSYKFERFITMYSKRRYPHSVRTDVPVEYSVTVAQITDYFNADLEAGRPILMGGEDANGGGGHEFVCDGRDANGKFHINWGWEGSGNCYTALTSMKPAGDSSEFKNNLDAIIGLEPDYPEAIEQTVVETAAKKVLVNGQVVIVRDNNKYTVLGQHIQ